MGLTETMCLLDLEVAQLENKYTGIKKAVPMEPLFL